MREPEGPADTDSEAAVIGGAVDVEPEPDVATEALESAGLGL